MSVGDSIDLDRVELRIVDTGERISFWTKFQATSDFLTPADEWQFVTADLEVVSRLRALLIPGARVTMCVNDKPQVTGFVDRLQVKASRAGGTVLTVTGRDTLGHVVDACVDPFLQFAEGTTLNDVLTRVIVDPFGFKLLSTTDIARRSVVTGRLAAKTSTQTIQSVVDKPSLKLSADGKTLSNEYETKKETITVSTQYDPSKPKFLKDITLKQAQPHTGEGSFEFCARLCKRFGLWLWVNEAGDTLICAEPDYDQPSSGTLYRTTRGCNFEEGEIHLDATNQPSVIIATGRGSSPDDPKADLVVAMVNELSGVDASGAVLPDVAAAIAKFSGLKALPLRPALLTFAPPYKNRAARPLYLDDDESQTQGQLEGFVRKEMAIRQSKGLRVDYLVRGLSQDGAPWAVNTIVDVDDDVLGIHERMWVKARLFRKDRGGSFTTLTLIRPHTLALS